MFGRRVIGIVLVLMFVMLLASCRADTVEVTRAVPVEVTRMVVETVVEEGEVVEVTRLVTRQVEVAVSAGAASGERRETPVTLNMHGTEDVATLDPQGEFAPANLIENLFVQLTNWKPGTSEIVPEAATSWEVSEDGLLVTFHLRGDIPWVYHNPVTGETTQVLDEAGLPRFVTAEDFANGIRRACDPEIATYYSGIIARVIAGCEERLQSEGDENDRQPLPDLGVRTPDEQTLVFRLKYPAAYFIPMTTLWSFSAIPAWTIEEHGNQNWTEAGLIVTNGRYVLHERVHGVRYTMLRNPLLPEPLRGEGNIARIVIDIVPDLSTGYLLWLTGEIDLTELPDGEVEGHLEHYPDQTIQEVDQFVYYLGFANTKPPFDDPRVRRAFSAAIDRETLVDVVRQGQGRPMIHFAPPANFGAPPIDEVGVGFNPEYAREQLAAAGYPGCEGLPPVFLLGVPGQEFLNLIEYVQGQWAEHLGCPDSLIQLELQPFLELLAATDASVPVEEVPHIFTLGWAADYPDENNWVGDVLWCGTEGQRIRRSCSAVDDLIVEAAEESDPEQRIALYRQIEEAFFGAEGEMPIAPLMSASPYLAVQRWLQPGPVTDSNQWYNWVIDWEMKQRAQE